MICEDKNNDKFFFYFENLKHKYVYLFIILKMLSHILLSRCTNLRFLNVSSINVFFFFFLKKLLNKSIFLKKLFVDVMIT